LKDLQAVILAAVPLIPVALGAGGKDVVSSLADEPWSAASHPELQDFGGLRGNGEAWRPRAGDVRAECVWKKNKAARKLLTLGVESLKWP
jgi:hypothetical protein